MSAAVHGNGSPVVSNRLTLPLLAIVAAGAWAYSTSFGGVFVYDDGPAIVDNPHIRSIWPLTQSMTAPPEVTVSGRPIAALTLAINYALAPADARDVMAPAGPAATADAASRFHRNIWGYHLLNLAIHLAAALALFGVVRRTLRSRKLRERFGRSATALAFASALLWMLHPLQTESVTYIVQRVEALMGLFYLLTLYCAIRAADSDPDRYSVEAGGDNRAHGRAREKPRAGKHRTSTPPASSRKAPTSLKAAWTAAAILACALGMGSKEVMVTAPLVVWLWDDVFLGRHRGRNGLYAGLAATWLILTALIASETRPQSVGFALGWTAWSYLGTQAGVVVHYLRLAFVPFPLVFDYEWPRARSLAEIAPAAALLIVLAGLTIVTLHRRHPLGFLGAWFFVILAPTSSVLPITTEIASEHRMYLPVAAVIVLAVVGVYDIGRRVLARAGAGATSSRRAGIVVGILLVGSVAGVFAEMTRARSRDYWSDERLWIDTVRKRPTNARARVGYGIDLLSGRRYADAEAQLRIAVGLNDLNALAHMNLGSALCAQGKLDEGIGHLERALALDPTRKETFGLLGEAYGSQGKSALAVNYFTRAIEVLPDNPFLLRRVAWELAVSPDAGVRDGARAVDLAERAVSITGHQDAISLDTLGAAYAEQRRFTAAVAAAHEALALARAQRDDALVAELAQHLAAYQMNRGLRPRP